ncbi:UDP-2,4-diacetamido-2,4,6-trideoxy-beta-L-altropyranose hydrolase [Anianabacter salinae]|uniref:UDP-2,4-diacetamido-2,4, 6-trideoxy-beta-L-altropyranose hydrolase n=1 Tax=Anianabacter salinae TaxID=2851023 RepID=UPI00225E15C2|nr:UDP-2,4-diacetamido-2,4,6-trideoxy-beta-L-altropyranose hydrolase [Anianabacter salinae]MBV0914157.1 UDP-2,4-diacetamido-2,4,6-trideoxy-beta-L-altropyranose hydrolase [Anianabacter salinae]
MNSSLRLAFRVDGSPEIGAGHLMRCLTLARGALARGDQVLFASKPLPDELRAKIVAQGIRFLDLPPEVSEDDDAVACLADRGFAQANWVVLDHYGLGTTWQERVRVPRRRLCVFEDMPNRVHHADLLLDPTYAPQDADRYRGLVPETCQLLLGPAYALVRPEVLEARTERRPPPTASAEWRIFVCLGGGETGRETLRVLQALDTVSTNVTVVMAQPSVHQTEIGQSLRGKRGWVLHLAPDHFAALMAGSDLAITGSGSITWEKCALGLPSLAVCLADNQRDIFTGLEAAGAHLACPLDPPRLRAAMEGLTADKLVGMGQAAHAICNGRGVAAVLEHLRSN